MSFLQIARPMIGIGFASALICAPASAAGSGENKEFDLIEPSAVWPVDSPTASGEVGENGLTPEQRLDIIESHLGIKNHIFTYSVATDRKLIISFTCKVAGEIYRPFTDSSAPEDKRNRGVIRLTSARGRQAGTELWGEAVPVPQVAKSAASNDPVPLSAPLVSTRQGRWWTEKTTTRGATSASMTKSARCSASASPVKSCRSRPTTPKAASRP